MSVTFREVIVHHRKRDGSYPPLKQTGYEYGGYCGEKQEHRKPLINGLFNEQTRDDKGDSKGFATLIQSLRKYAKVTCNYLVKLHGVEQLYFSKKPVRVSLFE